jgi:hypothetical protein
MNLWAFAEQQLPRWLLTLLLIGLGYCLVLLCHAVGLQLLAWWAVPELPAPLQQELAAAVTLTEIDTAMEQLASKKSLAEQ